MSCTRWWGTAFAQALVVVARDARAPSPARRDVNTGDGETRCFLAVQIGMSGQSRHRKEEETRVKNSWPVAHNMATQFSERLVPDDSARGAVGCNMRRYLLSQRL